MLTFALVVLIPLVATGTLLTVCSTATTTPVLTRSVASWEGGKGREKGRERNQREREGGGGGEETGRVYLPTQLKLSL